MWTQANRGRMANIEKKTKRYPSDLTDEEWERTGIWDAGNDIKVKQRDKK